VGIGLKPVNFASLRSLVNKVSSSQEELFSPRLVESNRLILSWFLIVSESPPIAPSFYAALIWRLLHKTTVPFGHGCRFFRRFFFARVEMQMPVGLIEPA
jgi:hypothetical protein